MAATVQRSAFEWRQVRVAGMILIGLLLLIWAIYRVGKIFDVFADRIKHIWVVRNPEKLKPWTAR